MTKHKAIMNWSGNYTYRGYTINKNGRTWDIFDNPLYDHKGKFIYAWSKKEAMQKIDNIIDRNEWKDA